MTMENPPFDHAFPIENGDFPVSHDVSFSGVYGIRISGEGSPNGGEKRTSFLSFLNKP